MNAIRSIVRKAIERRIESEDMKDASPLSLELSRNLALSRSGVGTASLPSVSSAISTYEWALIFVRIAKMQ